VLEGPAINDRVIGVLKLRRDAEIEIVAFSYAEMSIESTRSAPRTVRMKSSA
jgi:hypothetical protein